MGGASILMGIGSAIAASEKNKRAVEAANAEYAKKNELIENLYNQSYYQDITKRTDVQNMLRLLQENQDKQARRDEALSAITGATTESKLAAQDSRNKSYADALAEIASNASTLKDTYRQQYLTNKLNLTDPSIALLQNESNMWSQTANNMFQSAATALSSEGMLDEWRSVTGGKKTGGGKSSSQPSYFNAFNPQPIE